MVRFLLLSVLFLFPVSAKADYFLWEDAKSGLSLSFPDTWNVVHGQKPGEIITIIAPSQHDQPVCKVKVSEDKRFMIFPPRYGRDVQQVAVSKDFWEQYLAQYDRSVLTKVEDKAGLGRWHASYALASYAQHFGDVLQQRRAILFASLYNDKMYVVECSSLNHAYEKWAMPFQQVIKSIDFKKAYHELPTGEYNNFLKDHGTYLFEAPEGIEGTTLY